MLNVARLVPQETVGLDQDRIEVLYSGMGNSRADRVVARAMEELASRLARIENLYKCGEVAELQRLAQSMIAVSSEVGMVSFAKVARDVVDVAAARNDTALAACVARLLRIGEGSLMAVWDMQDASL